MYVASFNPSIDDYNACPNVPERVMEVIGDKGAGITLDECILIATYEDRITDEAYREAERWHKKVVALAKFHAVQAILHTRPELFLTYIDQQPEVLIRKVKGKVALKAV